MKYLIVLLAGLFPRAAFSQSAPTLFAAPDYPQGYFRDPLDIPMHLAANFGELRPDHYHMGLDIRTQHREDLPVRAAADGFVCRVEIEPEGFGQAIYIRHPNGYTTVYGHLNRFFPALAAYAAEAQYRHQSWQVDLTVAPFLFPVKKGELIAYSGNTGGSQGPHLHFEIRRTAGDINLNPLLFGLPVPDKVPPTILRLAWYDGNKGVYDQSPGILPVHPIRQRGLASVADYALDAPELLIPVRRVGFAISAFDTQSGSRNPNGIYRALLSEDDQPVIGFQLDHISYDDTRNINAHIDYKTRNTGGPFLQQMFFLPGYPFPSVYRIPGPSGGTDPAASPVDSGQRSGTGAHPLDGWIDIGDGRVHEIRIDATDPQGNRGVLRFKVRYVESGVIPMENGATSANAGQKTFYPGMLDGVETADYAFYLGERSLYDSAHIGAEVAGYPGLGLSLPGGLTPVYAIGARWIPLLDPVLVRLRLPDSVGMFDGRPIARDRIMMVCFHGSEKDVERPEWQGSWASARFREFGDFQLVCDTVAPVILPLGPLEGADLSHATRIAFSVKDNLGAIHGFRAELDGRWLCFTNDKYLAYIYKFDAHCPPGSHLLKISVADVAGNRSEAEYHFSR